MQTITREQFQAAIETGLGAAPELEADKAGSLRKVGREATKSSFGVFGYEPGCPVVQAGLYYVGIGADDGHLMRFVYAFDDAMKVALGPDIGLAEVIDANSN